MKPIGVNKVGAFNIAGRVDSSFNQVFDNNVQVLVNDGIFGDTQPAIIGNIDELYVILKEKLKNCDMTFESLMVVIYNIVTEYFGTFENASIRTYNYKSTDKISSTDDIGKVSDLKGKNAAMCVERAMVSHNLMKALGINSYYKASMIINNGKNEGHAYNIIEFNEKYYIFDATMPKLSENTITPIIAEIPKEVFDEITKANEDLGYPVQVEYFNAIKNEAKSIVYDSCSKTIPYNCQKNESTKKI